MLSQLDLGLGALEIGVLLSSTLWGVTTVQFYVYLITPNKDPLWTKVLNYCRDWGSLLEPERVVVVRRDYWGYCTVTLISWLGSLLQLAANVGVTIISGEFSLAEFGARFNWIVEATLIINLAVDVINTAGLSYYLNRERTGVEQTDAILVKLVVWTVETGPCQRRLFGSGSRYFTRSYIQTLSWRY
ncbi:hypothetical protein C8R44DRAFT_233885 [Mycena epipterygia]|nr:hypothetical protein C8R44DRAFT_233885 [Mycena epipterygia]